MHKRQLAQGRRRKSGSSAADKTIGTVLSQKLGHEDASGRATAGCTTVAPQRDAEAVAKPYPLDLPIDQVLTPPYGA